MRAIRQQMRSGRAPGMSVPQFRLLLFISRNPGTSLSPVADHLGTTLPAASQLVQRLVVSGLVARTQDPKERRRVELQLTESGAAALAECQAATREWLSDRLSALSAAELGRIEGTLRRLRGVLATDEE